MIKLGNLGVIEDGEVRQNYRVIEGSDQLLRVHGREAGPGEPERVRELGGDNRRENEEDEVKRKKGDELLNKINSLIFLRWVSTSLRPSHPLIELQFTTKTQGVSNTM
ncbi:hypothetical protein FF1_001898 [Malus domestica]